jgi:hypothetical protein
MILRDEAEKSAQKSSEEAALDVKLTVNLCTFLRSTEAVRICASSIHLKGT